MKTAETKTASTSHLHQKGQPFFQKNGESEFFSNRKSDLQTNPFFSKQAAQPFIQTKLTIGRPGDQYEQEADAMADQVVQRLSNSETVQTKPLTLANTVTPEVQPKCAGCEEEQLQKKEDDEDRLENGIQQKSIFESDEPPPEEEIQRKCAECDAEEKLQKKGEADSSKNASISSLESRLNASRGSGSPLPEATRTQMESSFGSDFSNVRIHTGTSAVQMNKELHAQAFTHGSDIYFNSGKYNPESSDGKHLLAHELTHTIQQGGAGKSGTAQTRIQRLPDWVSDAGSWVSDTASDAAGSIVEGAERVGGKVKDGAQWVGGKVAEGAGWVGDQFGAGAQWIIDRILALINKGTDYLNEKWESIKEFGRTCFEDIKTGFGSLIHFVTTPFSIFMTALSGMNADMLSGAWNLVKSGSNALWMGINAVINGVLRLGEGIWDTTTGFINNIFDRIEGLFDNTAFELLPDWIKGEARSIFNGLRSLWNQVSSFWTDLWQRLTSTIQEILAAVQTFSENVVSFAIGRVISMVRGLKEVYDYVTKFFTDPRATIQPFLDQIATKLNTEVPGRAKKLGARMAEENYAGSTVQTVDNGNIQKQALGDSEERTTATLGEVFEGIAYYIMQSWNDLDIGKMLWQTVVNMFWPPATIRAIVEQFHQLWSDDWATTVDSLYSPRNFFDNPIGCLHDIWSNFLILLDFPLSLWRTLNNVVALLMGYVAIIVVLAEAVAGAIAGSAAGGVGAVPGFFAGAAAGLATIAPLGEALMISYVAAEGSTVAVILARLFTARQTCVKRQVDILTSVASFIAMAVAFVLQVLMALLAELVSFIANAIRGGAKTAPAPQPTPKPSPQPAPAPQPVPARPAPAQPVPSQPAVPGGGGKVIPFPERPAPTPVTPEVPGNIAAKFEEGIHQVPFSETLPEDNKSSGERKDEFVATQESNPDSEAISLSGVPFSEGGTLQTAREDKIDPDKCEEEKKKICYRNSIILKIEGRSFVPVGAGPTPDDLRIPACVERTDTGTTDEAFKNRNIGVGRFLVDGNMEYIAAPNLERNIHSEDEVFRLAKQRFGAGNFTLSALFSERRPCERCTGNIYTYPRTPDFRVYCIINNDYDWRQIRDNYYNGVLF